MDDLIFIKQQMLNSYASLPCPGCIDKGSSYARKKGFPFFSKIVNQYSELDTYPLPRV